MKNWSVDEKNLKKNPKKHRLWRLEQLITYGLDEGEKINRRELIRNWSVIKNRIDPKRLETIKFLLWS